MNNEGVLWEKVQKTTVPHNKTCTFGLKAPGGLQNWRKDLGEFWKIQEILYLIGTEISQFGQREAEIIEFKEGWGLKSINQSREKLKF